MESSTRKRLARVKIHHLSHKTEQEERIREFVAGAFETGDSFAFGAWCIVSENHKIKHKTEQQQKLSTKYRPKVLASLQDEMTAQIMPNM